MPLVESITLAELPAEFVFPEPDDEASVPVVIRSRLASTLPSLPKVADVAASAVEVVVPLSFPVTPALAFVVESAPLPIAVPT